MAYVTDEQGVTVLLLDKSYDALDEAQMESLSRLLLQQVEGSPRPQLLLDFSQTQYIGSRVLEILFRTWKRVTDRGGRMALCSLSPFCSEVLHVTRLDTIWTIEPSRKAAIDRLKDRSPVSETADIKPMDAGNAGKPG
jgi:anti-anti-sigma factor